MTTNCTCPQLTEYGDHLPGCPIFLLGDDGLPCEGCEGTSGQPPVTELGFCEACAQAAHRNYPSRALELVGRYLAYCDACEAESPVTASGTSTDFDGSRFSWAKLECGHSIH